VNFLSDECVSPAAPEPGDSTSGYRGFRRLSFADFFGFFGLSLEEEEKEGGRKLLGN